MGPEPFDSLYSIFRTPSLALQTPTSIYCMRKVLRFSTFETRKAWLTTFRRALQLLRCRNMLSTATAGNLLRGFRGTSACSEPADPTD